jgi:hypothetical protein
MNTGDHADAFPNPVPSIRLCSRSRAVALTLSADEVGRGHEAAAVLRLLGQGVEGRMQPNPLIVFFADSALSRYGALDAALVVASLRDVKWRAFWREAAADQAAHREQSRKARVRRRAPE